MKTLLVIGATGDIGQGIVAQARRRGWNVVAAARHAGKLADAFDADDGVAIVAGDLSSDAGAMALWDNAARRFGAVDAVVVSVNGPQPARPVIDLGMDEVAAHYAANVLTHVIAARNVLPRLASNGVLLGIGGGTADFIIPTKVPTSMGHAALRMFYRGLARENRDAASIRELLVASMVAGASNRDTALPEWLTDAEIGEHVCAIIADPAAFPGPILQLRDRDQVGRPPVSAAP